MEINDPVFEKDEPKDLLGGEFLEAKEYVYAGQGQRFLNWVIDNLFINYAIGYGTGIVIGLVMQELVPELLYRIAAGDKGFYFYAFVYSIGAINYMLYYTLSEKLFRGYTFGKLITGTRAIRQDGEELTLKDAVLRSLSRCVPFEALSGFSTLTWHDKWTDTMVVKTR